MALKKVYAGVVSQEAISYQGAKSMLLQDLTFAFQNYIASGRWDQRGLDALNLSNIARKHTGLNLEFKVLAGECNAYALPPILDANNPLLDRFRIYGLTNIEQLGDAYMSFNKVRSFSKELQGSIDRANGRVTGVFSKIHTSITIGTGLWEKAGCTAEEVAAITLHEMGHVYTFLECLMQSTTLNMVLSSAAQALAKTTDMEHRLKLVYETEETLGVKVPDRDGAAKSGIRADTYSAIFIKATMDPKLRSAHGSATYDLRSSEFIADQFAARYGAGRHLVTGLDKMHRSFGNRHRMSGAVWVVSTVCQALFALMLFTTAPLSMVIFGLFFLIFGNPEARVYDDPGERVTRIRHDLIQSLKDNTLPQAARKQLLADIEAIDKIAEGIKDRRSLLNYLWLAVSPKRREQFNQMRFQQDLEKLVNNDLFVKAQQFKTLA